MLAKTRVFWTCGSELPFCLSDKMSSKLGPVDPVGANTCVLLIAALCRELRNAS